LEFVERAKEMDDEVSYPLYPSFLEEIRDVVVELMEILQQKFGRKSQFTSDGECIDLDSLNYEVHINWKRVTIYNFLMRICSRGNELLDKVVFHFLDFL
jgi:hypothetical protein